MNDAVKKVQLVEIARIFGRFLFSLYFVEDVNFLSLAGLEKIRWVAWMLLLRCRLQISGVHLAYVRVKAQYICFLCL